MSVPDLDETKLTTSVSHHLTFNATPGPGWDALFQFDRQKLRQRLNLRWKLHRDPGSWDEPLPHAILARHKDGSEMQLIGRITQGDESGEFIVTAIPPEWDGHPDYYLMRLGRFHA